MESSRTGLFRVLWLSLCVLAVVLLGVFSCSKQAAPSCPASCAQDADCSGCQGGKTTCQSGACEGPRTGPTPVTLQDGSFALVLDALRTRLTLTRAGETLSQLLLEGLQVGAVPEVEERYNYDPYWLLKQHGDKQKIPDFLAWLSPRKVTLLSQSAESFSLALEYADDIKAQLVVKRTAAGTFSLDLQGKPVQPRVVYVRIRMPVGATENFYGLGEYFDQVAHRGTVRAMQIELDAKLESAYNEAHVPVPFFTSTRAWGLFVQSYRPATFDMAKQDTGHVEVTYHASELRFFLFGARHPLEVPGLYTRVTGAPAVPARWAFGTLLWRDENRDQAEVLEDAANIRKHDLAISALWIDRPYDTTVNNFGFDPARYPDHNKMIQTLHAQGFRLGVWSTPYLTPQADQHDLFKKNGWFVKMGFAKLNKWSDPVDLTNPDAFAAWQKLIQRMIDIGIEGFKLDYGEDIQVGLSTARVRYGFHNGEDERTMHHKYALYYHRAYAEKLPKTGGFLICRGGTFGTQQYASIIWPGDLDTGFQKHYECDSQGTCHVGGLIASIIAGLSLSQSGFPFYGADTGGYRHQRPTKEVFVRWGQQTALSTIMQIGGADPNVNPWDFTKYKESQFDQQVLDVFRTYIRMHTRLFPYIYTYALHAQEHKPGPTRPFGMAFPEENFHPNDQYMLGDFLLVAPVVDATTKRSVRFPKAHDWIEWSGKKRFKGGSTVTYDAPLDLLPLFLRVGSIVPMLRPDIDTLSPTTDASTQSILPSPGVLTLRIVPGADANFTLYDQTSVTLEGDKTISVQIQAGKEFTSGISLEFLGLSAAPVSVKHDDKTLSSAPDQQAFDQCTTCWRWHQQQLLVKLSHQTKHFLSFSMP